MVLCHRSWFATPVRLTPSPPGLQDRCTHNFRNISAIFSRAGIFTTTGGKAYLVIHYNMKGTAGFIGSGLGHLHGFHYHALTCKSCITMQRNW